MIDTEQQPVSSNEPKRIKTLARVLFSSAKRRWGWAVGLGYSAVGVVLVAMFLEGQKWFALTAAAIVSLGAAVLRWWSEAVRGDADRVHRMHDILVSLGHPPDREVIAAVEARYSRLIERKGVSCPSKWPYFDATGLPSSRLLVVNMRESSWWTAQLADTAKRVVYVTASLATVVPACFVLADSMLVRAYGTTICLVVLMDMFYLGVRYAHLSTACKSAFSEFGNLAKEDTLSERQALLAATQYHFVRRVGPLIPDWLWHIRREKLNVVWSRLTPGEQKISVGQ